MKKAVVLSTLISLVTLISVTTFGFFYENPVYFLSGKNTLFFSTESYEFSSFNFSVAWQQREGNLFGEIGYTTDSTYATGTVNYRIVDIIKLYALNIKFKVLPLDKKALVVDAGGFMKVSDSFLLNFAIHDLTLYTEVQTRKLPIFNAYLQYLLPYSISMNIGVMNYETKYLHFDFGVSSGKMLPVGEFYVSYAPLYDFVGGKLYHFMNVKTSFVFSNYLFILRGFYNFSDVIPDQDELKAKYGIKFSLGFSM
ncbi:hypothetical protein [Fervidobacterium sp.]